MKFATNNDSVVSEDIYLFFTIGTHLSTKVNDVTISYVIRARVIDDKHADT